MRYEAPDTPPRYRGISDAINGVHDMNAEASRPGPRLDGKLCHTVCQAIRFLGGYYGPTLTEKVARVTPGGLEKFSAEVTEAIGRIDRAQLSVDERMELQHAIAVMMNFKSSDDE